VPTKIYISSCAHISFEINKSLKINYRPPPKKDQRRPPGEDLLYSVEASNLHVANTTKAITGPCLVKTRPRARNGKKTLQKAKRCTWGTRGSRPKGMGGRGNRQETVATRKPVQEAVAKSWSHFIRARLPLRYLLAVIRWRNNTFYSTYVHFTL
jgi:hypothetical protein